MAPKAPASADVAAFNRHEPVVPSTGLPADKLHKLAQGTLDESVKASAAKHFPTEKLSSYTNLDTVVNQQTETTPVPAPVTQTGTVTNPQSTAHGAVGDGSF